jgi:hypothetical protein
MWKPAGFDGVPSRRLLYRAPLSARHPAAPARVVAAVDDRDCSLAAVRRALALARVAGSPLEVLYAQPALPRGMILAALGVLVFPPSPEFDEALENEQFDISACIIATAGLSWSFTSLPRREIAAVIVGGPAATLVVAQHSRWLPLLRESLAGVARAASRQAARTRPQRPTDSLVVVDCDHRAHRVGRARKAPRWWSDLARSRNVSTLEHPEVLMSHPVSAQPTTPAPALGAGSAGSTAASQPTQTEPPAEQDEIEVILEGGPDGLPAASRRWRTSSAQQKIKVVYRGGYEHFERTTNTHDGEHCHRVVFEWTSRTRIAE